MKRVTEDQVKLYLDNDLGLSGILCVSFFQWALLCLVLFLINRERWGPDTFITVAVISLFVTFGVGVFAYMSEAAAHDDLRNNSRDDYARGLASGEVSISATSNILGRHITRFKREQAPANGN